MKGDDRDDGAIFREIVRDGDPASMQIAEDFLLERGWNLREVIGDPDARSFTVELAPGPKDERRAVTTQVSETTNPSRAILPMHSGFNVLPNASVQVAGRSQMAFRPGRIVIGGTPDDWIINDIRIGGRSQLVRSRDLPGGLFAATSIDSFVSFETVQIAMDFVILTTFVGASESGSPFICGVLGTAANQTSIQLDVISGMARVRRRRETAGDIGEAKRIAVANAWAIAKTIKPLPIDASKAAIEEIVDAHFTEKTQNLSPTELF